MSLTPQLLTALPEAVWPVASRRLWLLPPLAALAEKEPAVLNAWLKSAHMPEAWKPGALGLTAYAALHLEASEDAEGWLMNDGRDLLSAAYNELMNVTARRPLDSNKVSANAAEAVSKSIEQTLFTALALRVRGEVTADWDAMAREASAQPDSWRGPFQFLFGLLNDPQPLYAALLHTSVTTAELAAHALAVNYEVEAAYKLASTVTPPATHQLALVKALQVLGEETLAQRVAALPTEGGDLAVKAELLAMTGIYAQAQPALAAARQNLRQHYLHLTAQLGQLASGVGEHGVALAAFQAVLDEEPADANAQLATARTLLNLNEAEQSLEILRTAPEEPRAVLEAQALLALNQIEEAREKLVAVNTETLTAENAALAAEVWQKLHAPRHAAEAWRKAAQLTREASAFHHASRAFAENGDWVDAHANAVEAAARAPHTPEIREQLGLCLLETHQAMPAIPHFQAALAYAPKQLNAALGLARAALGAGQTQLAHDSATSVLAQNPTPTQEASAHVILGEALSALGQEAAAFEHFSRASVLAPANPGPWRAMAQHHRTRQATEQALATLEAGRQALKLAQSADSAPLLLDLAKTYTVAGRPAEAVSTLREACAAEPHSANAHRQLGLLLRRTGQAKEAAEALRTALNYKPDDAVALHELGLALEEIHQPREAWAMFQQAALAQPAEFAPYFDLGRATLEQLAHNNPDAQAAQAVAAFKQAIARDGEYADAHAMLAQAYHLNHQPKDALASYQNALRLAPQRTEWSLGLGQVCLQLHQPEVAVAALQEALTHAPHDVQIQSAFTEACLQAHLWPEAVRSAEAALRFDPNNVRLHGLQAEALSHMGQMPAAARAWEKAIRLAPRDTAVRLHYVRCLMGQHQLEEARDVLAQTLALAPDSAEVHLAAGKLLMDLNEPENALATLRQAAELAPRRADVQAAYGSAAIHAKEYEAAQAAYLRAAELDATHPEYQREAAQAAWQLGRTANAIALWENVIAQNPLDAVAQAQLGHALLSLGHAEEALQALEQALSHQPENITLAREAAEAALAAGFLPHAEAHLQTVLTHAPHDADARFLLGQVREQQSNSQQALALYEQAIQFNPNAGRYHAAAGALLAKLGQLPEAVEKMHSAVALSPENEIVQQQAGEVFLQANELPAASEAFARWASLRPQIGAAHLALGRALTLQAELTLLEAQAGIETPHSAERHAQLLNTLQQAAALGAEPEA
ncbi:MAG: tetratricopeptide repeat protein, partial [Anaerolineales bacterium]|nr:tetratricopeptide repeat protein [Anaerolineales bacterium]